MFPGEFGNSRSLMTQYGNTYFVWETTTKYIYLHVFIITMLAPNATKYITCFYYIFLSLTRYHTRTQSVGVFNQKKNKKHSFPGMIFPFYFSVHSAHSCFFGFVFPTTEYPPQQSNSTSSLFSFIIRAM